MGVSNLKETIHFLRDLGDVYHGISSHSFQHPYKNSSHNFYNIIIVILT